MKPLKGERKTIKKKSKIQNSENKFYKKLNLSEGPAKGEKKKKLAKTSTKYNAKKENNPEVQKITSFFDKICQKTATNHQKNAITNGKPATKSCDQEINMKEAISNKNVTPESHDQRCPEETKIRSTELMTSPSNPKNQKLAPKFPTD